MNALLGRIDMDTLVEQTDLGAVIARSTGGVASEALDAGRSQAVGLDQFIDRWVQRALRRKSPAPSAPHARLNGEAGADGEAEAASDPLSTTDSSTPQPPGETPPTPGASPQALVPPAPESGPPPARPGDTPAREATE